MKKIILSIIFTIVMINSTYANENNITNHIYEIKKINVYKDNEKNRRLASDLTSFNYGYYLLNEIPELKKDDLKYLRWEYFVKLSDNSVSFRLTLNSGSKNIIKHKDEIEKFFTKKVNHLIEHREKNLSTYKEGLKKAESYLKLLDEKKYKDFYNLFSNKTKSGVTLELFMKNVNEIENTLGKVKNRKYLSKIFHKDTTAEKEGYYVFSFIINTEKSKKAVEYLKIIYNENKYEIIAHNISW